LGEFQRPYITYPVEQQSIIGRVFVHDLRTKIWSFGTANFSFSDMAFAEFALAVFAVIVSLKRAHPKR
jgi:hypothetical protein